jgi:hypothetical protein
MKKVLAISLALILALALAVPALASDGSESKTVDALATVGGEADNTPYICAKWETPDHYPELDDTQVNPVPGGMRTVKFYVVVSDTNGIQDVDAVYIKVYHPDQSFKFQLDAFRPTWTVIPWTGMIDMDGDCTPDTPLSTALDQLDAEKRITYGFDPVRGATMDLGTLKYDLSHNKQFLVELVGYFHYHQPCGMYKVEALVTDGHGGLGTLVNYLKYESIVALRIDFSLINFDGVNPNEWNILYGDEDLGTPTKPTIQNIGNDPAMILLHASVMVGETHMKEITTFDAYMRGGYIEFQACVPTLIADESCPILLPPCTPTQIDFSVHPSEFVLPDMYRGTMTITILHYYCGEG